MDEELKIIDNKIFELRNKVSEIDKMLYYGSVNATDLSPAQLSEERFRIMTKINDLRHKKDNLIKDKFNSEDWRIVKDIRE